MAANLLLNYAVSFSEITGVSPVKLDYLKKAILVVKLKSNDLAQWSEVYDNEQVLALTDNDNGVEFFNAGMPSLFVLGLKSTESLDDAQAILDAHPNEAYTLVISDDFDDAAVKGNTLSFAGVKAATFTDRATAKAFAVVNKQSAGYSASGDNKGLCFAFGTMLANPVSWRDQQYLQYTSGQIDAITELGEANSLFNDRLTFYISDDDNGIRLAFFGAGGRSITDPYISEEIKRTLQSTGAQYISTNMPKKTPKMRILLQGELQSVIDDYVDKQYLDPEGENTILISRSNKQFIVNASMTTKASEAIWRMAIEAVKEI